MKNAKRELLNDVLTGLLVAATLSAAMPIDALAQNLAEVGSNAGTNIMDPFVKFASYIAYALGTILVVKGIHGCKMHADNATNNKLAPALGSLAAGGAFLIAPSVGSMLTGTGTALGVTGAGPSYSGFNVQ